MIAESHHCTNVGFGILMETVLNLIYCNELKLLFALSYNADPLICKDH